MDVNGCFYAKGEASIQEDIKVLEEMLKDMKADKNKACYVDRDSLIFPIIEHLIADNKRLDKENQALFEAYNFNDTNLLAKILKEYRKEILNSIPKSKVREKIEDYTEKSKTPLINTQARREYTFGVKALQELLEERN